VGFDRPFATEQAKIVGPCSRTRETGAFFVCRAGAIKSLAIRRSFFVRDIALIPMAVLTETEMGVIYDFSATTPGGETKALGDFAGQVLLIVNTASKCGFTPQYKGLEELYRKYGQQGFVVLAFPCNQFGAQEPGDQNEIAQFCSINYDVTFPIFVKIEVNGPRALPLYNFLKDEARGFLGSSQIKWNFTKFLIDRNGAVVARFAPATPPARLSKEIQKLL
jgi:glutathione peroxidase